MYKNIVQINDNHIYFVLKRKRAKKTRRELHRCVFVSNDLKGRVTQSQWLIVTHYSHDLHNK